VIVCLELEELEEGHIQEMRKKDCCNSSHRAWGERA
jgi:hypothetical protein